MSYIIANDLPYAAGAGLDPKRAIHDTLAFSARDWSTDRDLAWIYGIVSGWEDDEGSGMDDLAARHGWTPEQVQRLRSLHAAWGDS